MKDEDGKRRPWLAMTAAVLLCILLSVPSTRWLFGLQTIVLISNLSLEIDDDTSHLTTDDNALRLAANRHSNDYRLQVGYAVWPTVNGSSSSAKIKIERLQSLVDRFPSEPSLYAHILRYYTADKIKITRSDPLRLFPHAPADRSDSRQPAPADLARFNEAVTAGERLDPNNAYFPLMRAVALFASHQDKDALEAVHHAASLQHYEDYSNDEGGCLDRMSHERYGRDAALDRTRRIAHILFPHYAQIRGVARMATCMAGLAEQANRTEEGMLIRQDVMQIGSLMRVECRSLIGSVVGIAVVNIATTSPGGKQVLPAANDRVMTSAQREQRREADVRRYCDWARSLGHEDAATWLQAEAKAGRQVMQIGKVVSPLQPFGGRSLAHAAFWWAADIIVLCNMLGVLLLGNAAFFAWWIQSKKYASAYRFVLVYSVWLLLCALTSSSLFVLTHWVLYQFEDADVYVGKGLLFWILASPITVPVAVMLIIKIASKYAKVPFKTALGPALRGIAFPIAYVHFFVYCGLTIGTLRQEAVINSGLDRMIQHDGRYSAELLHRPWPGPTPRVK